MSQFVPGALQASQWGICFLFFIFYNSNESSQAPSMLCNGWAIGPRVLAWTVSSALGGAR